MLHLEFITLEEKLATYLKFIRFYYVHLYLFLGADTMTRLDVELTQYHIQDKRTHMCEIFGYGEDAFTLWALKYRIDNILEAFQDQTASSDCLIFYRPSFGRNGKKGSAVFGEFDAILVSSENVYLIESKWDNFSDFNDEKVTIKSVQKMRHRIFLWYLLHWDPKYSNNWKSFIQDHSSNFQKKFHGKKIALSDGLLATNLQSILTMLHKHRGKFLSASNIKNVLLFFYNKKRSKPPTKISRGFNLVPVDYSQEIENNFIALE